MTTPTLMTAAQLKTWLLEKKAAERFNLTTFNPQQWAESCLAEAIAQFKLGAACTGEFCHSMALATTVARHARVLGYIARVTPESGGARVVISPEVLPVIEE